ncbi:MAG: mechanosensitive ion channel family protein [Chitinispirillaceae bacterium]
MKRILNLFPFFLLLFIFKIPVQAQSENPVPDSISESRIEHVLQLLEDPQQREEFASKLRAVLQAKEQVGDTAGEKTSSSVLTVNLFEKLESVRNRSISTLREMGEELSSLPLSYERVKSQMSTEEYQERFTSFILLLIGTVVAAAAFLVVLLYFSKKIKNRYSRNWAQALSYVLTGSAFWASISLWGFLFNFLFDFPIGFEGFIFRVSVACLLFSFIRASIHAMFRPDDPDLKLIPVNETRSWYIVHWSGRLLRFSLLMFLLFQTAAFLQLPVMMAAFDALAKTGIAAMLAVVAYQKRSAMDFSRHISPVEGSAKWKNAIRGAVHFFLQRFYIFVIFYLFLVGIISLLGFKAAFETLISVSIRSVLLLGVLIAVLTLWRFVLRYVSSRSTSMAKAFPDFHVQFRRNVRLVERIGYGVVSLAFVPVFLQLWGIGLISQIREWYPALRVLTNIVIIVGVSVLALYIISFLVSNFQKSAANRMLSSRAVNDVEVQKRVDTLGKVLRKIAFSAVIVIAFLMVMDELGIDIKAMLAGVGIVGLAVGFGAQSLVRDVISGLFIIFENRIRVGDVAIINGTGGLVEQVNLRTSVLRSLDGTVHVFPNGTISTLSNMTYEYSFYIFDIGVAYKEDTDKVVSVVREVGDQIMTEPEFDEAILEPIEILGVDKFADSSVVVKARIKTQPIKQWMVGREINRRIKKRFDELGIEIPFPHTSLYFGEASKPISFRMEGAGGMNKEEIRELMRDVLREDLQKG